MRAGLLDVFGFEEGEGGVGGDHFYFDFVMLVVQGRSSIGSCYCFEVGEVVDRRTRRREATMRGALTEATLPVVMRRTCVCPSERSFSAIKVC